MSVKKPKNKKSAKRRIFV